MLVLFDREGEDELLAGSSAAAARLRAFVERVARAPKAPVLLLGGGPEAELLARSIHARSAPPSAPLVPVDPPELRGESVASLASLARAGTLHWKRVESLDPARQRDLECLLEQRARPGTDADPRIVASTVVDLARLVREGRFREELYYRLNVLTLRIPPLAERVADLEALSQRALRAAGAALGRTFTLSAEAFEPLRGHDWPGGLLELENRVVSAALRCSGSAIASVGDAPARPGSSLAPRRAGAASLRDLEESAIRRALEHERGNRSRAARSLGIHRATLHNKLRLYGIA